MPDTCPIISFLAAGGEVELRACTPRAIRVRFFGPPVVTEASYVGGEEWPAVPSAEAMSETAAGERISTGRLTLQVEQGPPLGLVLFDAAGRRLFGMPARGGIV